MQRSWRAAIVACGLMATAPAAAAVIQTVPGTVAYFAGSVMAGGEPGLCTVNLVMVDVVAGQTIDFQFLASANRFGFKVGAGALDAETGVFTPRRIASADFAGVRFNYRQAFGRRVLGSGQLVAMLGQSVLNEEFYQAFFLGHFVLLVQTADAGDATAWFVEQPPGETVQRGFVDCMRGLGG